MPAMRSRRWLTVTHPIYDACKDEWARNERMMRGGTEALDELVLFDWELDDGPHVRARARQAVYHNFPDRFASMMVGHMMRQAPKIGGTLDFGSLGKVRRLRDAAKPKPAELLFYNTDGRGSDGSQWGEYWTQVCKYAIATGHRWVFVEGPPEAAEDRADEAAGARPIVTDLSPLSVTNWHYEDGMLAWAIIRRTVRRPRLEGDRFVGNKPELEYVLLTRAGVTAFGDEFADGGWFTFDKNGALTDFGDYDATGGEIPLVPLYYERIRPQDGVPRMSRSGVTEIVNAAVLHMNLSSAASFDVWDAATSVTALRGVDEKGFNLFLEMVERGNRWAPLPVNEDTKQMPDVVDASMGAVIADVFAKRIGQVKSEVVELMLNEIQVSPDASGVARRVSWTDVRTPKLVVFAANTGTAQNAVLRWVEQMWGTAQGEPSASVEWPSEFDLIDPQAVATGFFDMEKLAGVSSPTLKTKVMVLVAKANGFLGDDAEEVTVEREYRESAVAAQERQAQLDALLDAPPPSTARARSDSPAMTDIPRTAPAA